jgi:hypothetical protein
VRKLPYVFLAALVFGAKRRLSSKIRPHERKFMKSIFEIFAVSHQSSLGVGETKKSARRRQEINDALPRILEIRAPKLGD